MAAITLDYYRKFRFIIEINNKPLGLSAVYQDPFTGSLWLERGLQIGGKTLNDLLPESGSLDVILMGRGAVSALKLHVNYEGKKWYPIDLNSTENNVAIEKLMLCKATCTTSEIVPPISVAVPAPQ